MPKSKDSDQERNTPKSKVPKKPKNDKRSKKNRKIKKVKQQDSDSDSEWLPGDEVDEISTIEMQQLMQKMFPSKAGKERLKKLEKIETIKSNKIKKNTLKKLKKKKDDVSDDEEAAFLELCQNVINKKESSKKKEEEDYEEYDDEDEDEDEDDYQDINGHLVEEDEDEDEEEFDEDEIMDMLGKNMQFNIVFTVPGMETEESHLEDDEDLSSNESSEKKEENKELVVGDKVIVKARDWHESYTGKIIKIGKRNHYDVCLDDKELEQTKWKHIHRKWITKKTPEKMSHLKMVEDLGELMTIRKNKGKNAAMEYLDKLSIAAKKESQIELKKEEEKEKNKNVVKLQKLFRAKGNAKDELKFFKGLELTAQKHIIEELKAVNKFSNVDKPYRISLLESNIPIEFKAVALKKLNILNYMDPSSSEYYKIKQWVDGFMRIPFGKTTHLPVKLSDGQDSCSKFMEEAKQILDDCVYGLNDAKMQIMQFLGQLIANPNSVGSAIAIQGPPGTGKTTLIREGISKILKRPFALIALGGATDASFLEGHSYTYEGSSWGKVVDILLNSKTMNPLIYFDELDKISSTPKGEEITGILTHLIDTSQSDQFHDKYFSSVSFDVSKTLFIFSYNDEKKINPILKDRMYRIHTAGYSTKDKLVIAKDHLIPKIAKNISFEPDSVQIDDKTLTHIIDKFTEKEKGVRNLKRCLEILYTKINLYKMMKPDSKLFDGETVLEITSPFTVTEDIVKKLIKAEDFNTVPFGMYI